MNYPKAIRIARSLADMSQGQLADLAEIDRSYLSLIESGKRQPSVETIEKISNALKLPFHLLSLLGSEEADVQKTSHDQIASLALALTKLLLEVKDGPSLGGNGDDQQGDQTQSQSERTRTPTRRRPSNPAKPRGKLAGRVQALRTGKAAKAFPTGD